MDKFLTLEDFAIGYGSPITKPDYLPPREYYCSQPLTGGYRLGHFLLAHLDVIPKQATVHESNAFRTKVKAYTQGDREKENDLLGLYLYCRKGIGDNTRDYKPAAELRKEAREMERALKNKFISRPEKERIGKRLDWNRSLQKFASATPHRRAENVYRDAAVYVIYHLLTTYDGKKPKLRQVAAMFQTVFGYTLTQNQMRVIRESESKIKSGSGFFI